MTTKLRNEILRRFKDGDGVETIAKYFWAGRDLPGGPLNATWAVESVIRQAMLAVDKRKAVKR